VIGQDAVVSALGRSASVRAERLFTLAAAAVIDAAEEQGVSRLVWLSSFGVGDTYRSASVVQKIMYRMFLRDICADKDLSEKAIRSSGLDWTLVYPALLTKGPAKGPRQGHLPRRRPAPDEGQPEDRPRGRRRLPAQGGPQHRVDPPRRRRHGLITLWWSFGPGPS
jgi:hypothetical protein